MKTLWWLIAKDFRRDYRRPWTLVLFSALPLLMTSLMAAVFGGHGGASPRVSVRVAILDQDRDLLTRVLRALPAQDDAARQLRLQFVDTREEGVRLLEERRASAFLALPPKLTENLLDGVPSVVDLYENPAEQVLPRVVRQGVSLLAAGVSAGVDVLREPLRRIRDLTHDDAFPSELAVGGAATEITRQLGHTRGYLFPPLVQWKTIEARDFEPQTGMSAPPVPTP